MATLLTSENSSESTAKENFVKHCAVLIALILNLALTGCNTVKGVGQDLQKAGEMIEDSVKKK
jgi:predicted small secreted protein